jgi:cytochrome c553
MLDVSQWSGGPGFHHGSMKPPRSTRFAALVILGAASALHAQAPGSASDLPKAATASPATPAASNALLVLPQWAQDKVLAARQDPRAWEQAYKLGAKLAPFCANCHGPAGHSVSPGTPNLAAQNTVYVLNQLNKFHDGRRRGNFFMEGLVRGMSNEERFGLAVYYTDQEPASFKVQDASLAGKGQSIYQQSCKRCHGEAGAGSERNSRIAGQHPEYLEMSIKRYRENKDRSEDRMFKATRVLSDDEIKALAAYIGSLR